MVNDFLDNLGARQHRKMTEKNATKEEITNTCEETFGKKACHEETYYNSESEGKEYKINDEIFKDFDEKYDDYIQTGSQENYFYAPENYGTWETQTQEETWTQT